MFLISLNQIGAQCDTPEAIVGENQTICRGETVALGCSPINEDWCYQWYPVSAFTDLASSRLANPTTLPIEEETEFILILNDNNGNAIQLSVTVFIDDLMVEAGEPEEICFEETVTLTATVTGATSFNYLWSTGETTQSIDVTPSETSIYAVEVTDTENGCTASDEVLVSVLPRADVKILASSESICEAAPMKPDSDNIDNNNNKLAGCGDDIITLYAGTGISGFTYLWSTGEITPQIEVVKAGIYTVTVTSPQGCSLTALHKVQSCIEMTITPDVMPVGQEEVQILDAGSGFSEYVWHDGSTNQTIEITTPGTYSVTVVDDVNGCMSYDELTIDDPIEDDFVLLILATGHNHIRDIYICNELMNAELTEEEKRQIEIMVGAFAKTMAILSETNFFWTCEASHSEIRYVVKEDVTRIYKAHFKRKEGVPNEFEQVFHYLTPSNTWEAYRYELSNIAPLPNLILENSLESFPIDWSLVPQDELFPTLSSNSPSNSSFSPVATMNIEFEPTVSSGGSDYILYYKESVAPSEADAEEKSFVGLEVKWDNMGTHEEVTIGTSGNPGEVESIAWRVDNLLQLDLANENSVNIKVPEYSGPNQDVEISVSVDYSTVGNIIIHPIDVPPVPGYHTPDPYVELPADPVSNTKSPSDYVTAALENIESTNSGMFNEVINGRQVDIILTVSSDKNAFKTIRDNGGIAYGEADIDYKPDLRLHIDPNLIVYSTEESFVSCPIDAPLLLDITGNEYSQIVAAMNDIVSPQIPQVVLRIKDTYSELGGALEGWCQLTNQSEVNQKLAVLNQLREDRKLSYEEDDITTLTSMITIPEDAEIYLAVDNLNDCRKYGTVIPPMGSFSFSGSGNVVNRWYPENDYNESFFSVNVDALRIKQYTRTLAHEIKHIHNALLDSVNRTKWGFIRDAVDIGVFCYPGSGGTGVTYCSNAAGHEHMNQDGLDACAEEGNYDEAIHHVQN